MRFIKQKNKTASNFGGGKNVEKYGQNVDKTFKRTLLTAYHYF